VLKQRVSAGHVVEVETFGLPPSGTDAVWRVEGVLVGGRHHRQQPAATRALARNPRAVGRSPDPLAVILVPITTAMANLGLHSLGSTLMWGWLLIGIAVPVAHPFLFVLAIVVSIFSIALIGFLLSVAVVRYRAAWAMGNLLDYPRLVDLRISGASDNLPAVGRLDRLRAAPDLGLGLAYGLTGAVLSETVLRSARRHATLSLT
jgi:ABC-2 type transport system permease protein